MKKAMVIKALAFILISVFLFTVINTALIEDRNDGYQRIAGFYRESSRALDAVYIGSSMVYTYWEAPLAWKHYGIAVWPMSTSAQSIYAAEYLIREARKTQPDALYIVEITYVESSAQPAQIHRITDFMPISANKLRLIWRLSDLNQLSLDDRLEYLFPLLRFHSRWNTLKAGEVFPELDGLKGGVVYKKVATDVEDLQNMEDARLEDGIPDQLLSAMESLLDYCDKENVNMLFVAAARANNDEEIWATCNSLEDYFVSRGYPVLNMRSKVSEFGMDVTTDYSSVNLANIHGAVKTTDYLARYLVSHYDFEDKRGKPEWSDWDASYSKLVERMAPCTLPFEYENTDQNDSLAAPAVSGPKKDGTLRWEVVEGADGYGVFRKSGKGAWELLTTVSADTLSWQETEESDGEKRKYTVVAYTEGTNGKLWGRFNAAVVSG